MKISKVEIVGVVFAVTVDDLPDPYATPYVSPSDWLGEEFIKRGFDVQAASPHIDGLYRVEVLS